MKYNKLFNHSEFYLFIFKIRVFILSNESKWADACYVNDILLFYYHLNNRYQINRDSSMIREILILYDI